MTVVQGPVWPDGDSGKALLHFVAECSVDALWEDFFGSYPELQAKLHKQRNDTNCAESPWVSDRAQLPVQQFVWPPPPAGADPGTAAQGKIRKVRFDAAASLASKAFSSEEVQKILAYQPGKYYLVESEVYTTALYGDQFCVLSRTSISARGPRQCQLQLVYTIDFKPSLSRLMKPMVAKGVDGGIRGSFSTLKKLLQEQYSLVDLPDSAPPPAIPSGLIPEAQVQPQQPLPAAAAAAAVPAVSSAAPAGSVLFSVADYIVYQELVASILKVSDPQVVAKGLAVGLTLLLIHMLITVLQPVAQYCAGAATAAQAGASGGWLSSLCWPFSSFISLPSNVGQVVMSLVLVAVANKLLLLGAEVLAAYARGLPGVPARIAGHEPVTSAATATADGTSANGVDAQDTQQQAAAAEPVTGPLQRGKQLKKQKAPHEGSSTRARGSAIAEPSGSSDALSLVQNLGNVMSGWGATMDEGIKAIMSGSWSRSAVSDTKSTAPQSGSSGGQGPGSAPDHTGSTSLTTSSSLGRAISHRHTTSFTAVMDPSGLNIIEDYAQLQQLSGLPEEQLEQQGSAPRTPAVESRTAEAGDQAPSGSAADGRSGSALGSLAAAAASGVSATAGHDSSVAASPGTSKSPAGSRSSSPTKASSKAGSRMALAADEHDQGVVQPLLTADGEASECRGSEQDTAAPGSVSRSVTDESPASAEKEGPKRNGDKSQRTPSPPVTQLSPRPRSAGKIVSFPKDTSNNSLDVDKSAASFSNGSAGKMERSLARRSASPLLYGASGADKTGSSSPTNSRPGSRTSMREGLIPSYQALAPGDVGYVVPGEEDDDEVCVEVFEHERVQPFRGWGHTWPGHFLPSDKVGHWGDRSGAPGGQLSMLFDRVAPQPPPGWEWKDEEWQVDLTASDVEGCDVDGWSYGMDFSWLTWPPTPQSGRPGLKSFVRRRRWIRTRRRLPAGSIEQTAAEAVAESEQAVLVEAPVMPSSPLHTEGCGELGLGLRRGGGGGGGGEGGLMAGLGVGLGGLVGSDSSAAAAATAAVASATAMMNRFMRAVTEGPLPAGNVDEAEAAASSSAAAASPSGVATGVGLASPKQVSTGSASDAVGSATATAVDGGNNNEDDSSSSVDSDLVPPRPDLQAVPEGWRQAQVTSTQADSGAVEGDSGSKPASAVGTAAAAAAAVVIALDAAVESQQGDGQPIPERQGDAANLFETAAAADQSTGECSTASTKGSATTAKAPAASTADADSPQQATPQPTDATSSTVAPNKLGFPVTNNTGSDNGKQQQEHLLVESETGDAISSATVVPQQVAASSSTCGASAVGLPHATVETPGAQADSSTLSTADTNTPAVSYTATAIATALEQQGRMTGDAEVQQTEQGVTAATAPQHVKSSEVTTPESADGVDNMTSVSGAQSSGNDWVWTTAGSQTSSGGSDAASPEVAASPTPDGSFGSTALAIRSALPTEQLVLHPQTAHQRDAAVQGASTSDVTAANPQEHAAPVSQSSTGLCVTESGPGISRRSSSSASNPSSSRTPRSAVFEGRRVGRRSSSGGAGGSRTSGAGGRPKLGAVSLKQSAAEAGLRSSGGSGVISPTATAAAAAANSEWESKAGLMSQSSLTTRGSGVRLADGCAHQVEPDSREKAAASEVYGANDMGSGLLCAEGAGSAEPESSGDK